MVVHNTNLLNIKRITGTRTLTVLGSVYRSLLIFFLFLLFFCFPPSSEICGNLTESEVSILLYPHWYLCFFNTYCTWEFNCICHGPAWSLSIHSDISEIFVVLLISTISLNKNTLFCELRKNFRKIFMQQSKKFICPDDLFWNHMKISNSLLSFWFILILVKSCS